MSRRVAILIASGTFEPRSGLANLSTPANDVTRLGEVLRDPRIGRFDVVKELVDVRCHATRVAVNRLLSEVTREDFVLIYYSGHGKLDFNGGLCLTMTDTRPNLLGATSMKMSELQGYLAESKCKRVALILDCCYSGAVGRSFTKGDVAGELTSAAASGLCILTASSALQTAMESPEDGLGVFTKHLVEGLTTGAADRDGDGAISHDELIDYVRMGVARDGHQRPESFTFSVNGRLPIAFAEKRTAAQARPTPPSPVVKTRVPASSETPSVRAIPTDPSKTEAERSRSAAGARARHRRTLAKISIGITGFVLILWAALQWLPDPLPGEVNAADWVPGAPFPDWPHVYALKTPGRCAPDPGYWWVVQGSQTDLRVRWDPRQRHPEDRDKMAAESEGAWVRATADAIDRKRE